MQLLNESLITSATLIGYLENGSEAWHSARNEPGAIGGSDIASQANCTPKKIMIPLKTVATPMHGCAVRYRGSLLKHRMQDNA